MTPAEDKGEAEETSVDAAVMGDGWNFGKSVTKEFSRLRKDVFSSTWICLWEELR